MIRSRKLPHADQNRRQGTTRCRGWVPSFDQLVTLLKIIARARSKSSPAPSDNNWRQRHSTLFCCAVKFVNEIDRRVRSNNSFGGVQKNLRVDTLKKSRK